MAATIGTDCTHLESRRSRGLATGSPLFTECDERNVSLPVDAVVIAVCAMEALGGDEFDPRRARRTALKNGRTLIEGFEEESTPTDRVSVSTWGPRLRRWTAARRPTAHRPSLSRSGRTGRRLGFVALPMTPFESILEGVVDRCAM